MGPGDPATKGSYNSSTCAGTETPPPLELELELITSTTLNNPNNNNNNNIDDLPELLLVEILSRLGSNKFAFQCKCVSKRWCELISTPHFICTYVRLQHDLQTSILSTLVARDKFFPVLETTCQSKGSESPSLTLELPFIPDIQQLYVVGACNDLLLCCPTQIDQRDYYICNPYTKKWVALPPPNRVHQFVKIGFICDPYYNFIDDSTSNSTNIIELNTKYRWRIVRIIPNFYVDIFFSETGEWRESVNVLSSRHYYEVNSPGVAYNGKLYWSGSDKYTAFTIELDPFSNTSTTNGGIIVDKCRFTPGPIEWPYDEPIPWEEVLHMCVGASRGCLRACEREPSEIISVWELERGVNDLVVGADGNLKWRLVENKISCNQMEPSSDLPYGIGGAIIVLGFHPTNEDIMYLDVSFNVVMCNLGARTAELVPGIPSQSQWNYNYIHPLVLPWWPTPVPRL